MNIVGIDYSTHGCDVVSLDLEHDTASWRRIDFPGAGALARARGVRDAMPSRGSWIDDGAALIVIERPMSRNLQLLTPLMRTLGAMHACLPTSVEVWELSPVEWRRELGLKMTAAKEVSKAQAAAFAAERWRDLPVLVTQDAIDAFCVAYAARRMCEKAAAA
jgi:hypothetical protein